MSTTLLSKVAAVCVCLLATTNAGFAQTGYHRPLPAATSAQQYSSSVTLLGVYHSNDFFPSPLTLTITGIDRWGNLSGSIGGMRSYQPQGQVDYRWENWGHVFGQDARASYRDGKVTIVFSNGATYTLDNRGTMLAGTFVAGNERHAMTFLKSQGLASGR